jgi:predicted enzyme related to lactoylglutathione lyase
MSIFPYTEPNSGGALVAMPQLAPRDNGTLIYLDGGDDLNTVLARIPAAGGKIVMEKTDLGGGIGHIALFIDSEGNRVGVYSPH